MDVSVAICTYNRANYLEKTLRALIRQMPDDNRYKAQVIIVDNNSTDETKVVVENIKAQCDITIDYVLESRQGLSYARNKAIEMCQSTILIFLDDDAMPSENWVGEHLRVYETTNAACVGGKIELGWEGERPKWLGDQLLAYLGYFDYADKVVPFAEKQFPFGGNISFRMGWLKEVGGFDGTLGRKGTVLLDSEEIAVCEGICQRGGEIWYTPTASVVHAVAPHRIQKDYFLRSAYWKGRSAARMGIVTGHKVPTLLRAIKRGTIRLPVDTLAYIFFSVIGQGDAAMYHRCELRVDLGFLHEYSRYLLRLDQVAN